jgi:hypothetical protein
LRNSKKKEKEISYLFVLFFSSTFQFVSLIERID